MGLFTNPLFVTLGLRSKGFERGLDRSKKKVSSFDRSISKASKNIIKFGAAIFGVRALSRGFTDAIDRMDRIAKASEKLKIPVKQLQVLAAAAELAGVEFKQFETGIQRLGRRLGGQERGQTLISQTLEDIGLKAKDLNQLSLDQSFLKIGDAVTKLAGDNEKLSVTQNLVDSEAVNLIRVWQQGSEAIRKLGFDMERLGQLMDREQIQKAVKARDAITKMRFAWESFTNRLAIGFAEPLSELLRLLESVADKMVQISNTVGRKGVVSFLGENSRILRAMVGGPSGSPTHLPPIGLTGNNAEDTQLLRQMTGILDRRLTPGAQ